MSVGAHMNAEDLVLPWHHAFWEQLVSRINSGTLPHALILSGLPGLGKRAFARRLSQALLCQTPSDIGDACGQCKTCKLFLASTHPDYLPIIPEEDSKVLKIDQIRNLSEKLSLRSNFLKEKVALLDPADQMNAAAANSLLKTLEEPTPATVIILVADNPARLPATIRSRCQQFVFVPPAAEMSRNWLTKNSEVSSDQSALALELAHGAPIRALAFLQDEYLAVRGDWFTSFVALIEGKQDPVGLAKIISSKDLNAGLDHLISWAVDLVRLSQVGKTSRIGNCDREGALHRIAVRLDLPWLYKRYDQLLRGRSLLQTQVNPQLLMEDMLLPWYRSAAGTR